MEYLKLNIQLFAAITNEATASSTSTSGGNTSTLYCKFTESIPTSAEKLANKTKITAYCTYKQGGSFSAYYTPKLKLTWYDDNENKNGKLLGTLSVTSMASKEVKEIRPAAFYVAHNDDGTLNGYLKAEWIWTGNGYACKSATATTKSTKLTAIPRAKTIGAVSADIGYDTTITLGQTSESFTTTIEYECGELSDVIVDKTPLISIPWKIPTEIYSQLTPTDKEIAVTLKATTFNGEDQIGSTQTTTFKARVNEEDNRPIAYLGAIDINDITVALTNDENKVVLNASNILTNFTGMAQNGATISSITVNGIPVGYSLQEIEGSDIPDTVTEIGAGTYTINKPTTNVFTLTVTDSRGFTNAITTENQKTLDKIDYIIPTISATFKRNTPVDGLVNVRYDGKFFKGDFKSGTSNVLEMAYQYKEKGTETYSDWIALTLVISSEENSYGGQIRLNEEFDYEKQFDFRLSVKDLVNDYGVVFTTGSIAKGKPSHWYDDENFYVEGGYYQRNKETGKWFKPIGNLTDLETDDKGSVVRAINSLCSKKGDFISVYRSSDYKLTATNTYTTIPFNITFQSRGSSLTLQSDGGIKIGAGVNTIAINGQFYFYTGTIGFKAVQIQKNSQTISRTTYQNVDQYTMINACRQIANVSEGDIIYLQANGSSNDVIKAYQHSTFMCVEVIA